MVMFPEDKIAANLSLMLLAACTVFLQYGFSYYVSVQTFCLVFVIIFCWLGRPFFRNIIFVALLFTWLFLFNWSYFCFSSHAEMLYQNTFLRLCSVTLFSAFALAVTSVEFQKPEFLHRSMRVLARCVLCFLLLTLFISEFEILQGFDRRYFILQNSDLIFNRTDIDTLNAEIFGATRNNRPLRVDLFYGEPSYLALVIYVFASILSLTTLHDTSAGTQKLHQFDIFSGRGKFDFLIIIFQFGA